MANQAAAAALFVCSSGSRRCGGRIQDVRRNFSTLRRRVCGAALQPLPPLPTPHLLPRRTIATLIPRSDIARPRTDAARRYISINSAIDFRR
ncbi:jg18469 [Pararge aegeria aegeria]|uniref:Jg18469 protein n=1 Tax=Pararge aegeria aegeria TaxID=348720 RepID=A0A8S4RMD3_9NEOP|nr:jg18469 [Pararge aegeria aegeria]